MAPLNEKEIVVLGGWDKGMNCLGDVVVFETKTNTCKKVVSGEGRAFVTADNQCIQVGNNRVLALVSEQNNNATLIEWTNGAS